MNPYYPDMLFSAVYELLKTFFLLLILPHRWELQWFHTIESKYPLPASFTALWLSLNHQYEPLNSFRMAHLCVEYNTVAIP